MNKRVLIQYATGAHYEEMLSETRELHKSYADSWSIDYFVEKPQTHTHKTAHYHRIELFLRMIDLGYDHIAWLDSDSIIVDPSVCIFDASNYGIACCECYDSPKEEKHLNTGFLIITSSIETRAFLETWRSTRAANHPWHDQYTFIRLMEQPRFRSLLTILPNRFNYVNIHMEAPNPIIRSFHGDPERLQSIKLLAENYRTTRNG